MSEESRAAAKLQPAAPTELVTDCHQLPPVPPVAKEATAQKDCDFDGMLWPYPNHQLGWKMRYAPQLLTPQETMRAARELDAYARLVQLPQRKRNRICSQIGKGPNA